MNQPYSIMLLGRLCVEGGKEASPAITRFRTQKTALLLAYLAAHPAQSHAREVLVDLLWSDDGVDEGRVSLRTALASLRRQLEPPGVVAGSVLVADRTYLCLEPRAFTTDIARFEKALADARRTTAMAERMEHLRIALALYAGPFLPGFYDDWVLTRRDHLSELHRQAVQQIVVDLGRSGDLPGALQQARNAVAADPQNAAFREMLEQLQSVGDKTAGVGANTFTTPLTSPIVAAIAASTKPSIEGNLPLSLSRFFGRMVELEEIATTLHLPTTRLLTLIGAGGTGKTRLSTEAAAQMRNEWTGGIWFVSLAEARSAEQIIPLLHKTLGLVRAPNTEPIDAILAVLNDHGARPALLIFDNMEQIAAGASSVLMRLLSGAPQVKVLTTSRCRLAMPGEVVMGIAPLPIPLPDEEPDRETLMANPSVQLFADRARACRPDFQVTARNAPSVAGLCADLEGIPLALELAAAWSRTLSPAQMRERLAERFALLTARPNKLADRAERHRSLEATISWSYDLLAPNQQRFLASLSLFRGGWTADAAQVVCDAPQAMDLLAILSERSLIVSQETETGEIRFRMLDTIRAFALEHIAWEDQGAHAPLKQRYRQYFVTWAEAVVASAGNVTSLSLAILNRLEQELPNLSAVLHFTAYTPDAREQKLRLFGALENYWLVRGEWHTVWNYAQFLLGPCDIAEPAPSDASDEPLVLARALHTAAHIAYSLAEYSAAEALLQRSESAVPSVYDLAEAAGRTRLWAKIALAQGDVTKARCYAGQALRLFHRQKDIAGMAAVRTSLGTIALEQNDLVRAERYLKKSLVAHRGASDLRGQSIALASLAIVAFHRGDMESARTLREDDLQIARRLRDQHGIAIALHNLGLIKQEQGDLEGASQDFAEAERIHRRLGDPSGVATTLLSAAIVAFRREDLTNSRTLIENAIALWRPLGSKRQIASALVNLGVVARQQEDYETALSATRESLRLFHEVNYPVGVAFALEGIAALEDNVVEQGRIRGHTETVRARNAVLYWGAADALRLAIGYPLPTSSVEGQQGRRARIRIILGDAEYDAALAQGMALPLDQAVAIAAEA